MRAPYAGLVADQWPCVPLREQNCSIWQAYPCDSLSATQALQVESAGLESSINEAWMISLKQR